MLSARIAASEISVYPPVCASHSGAVSVVSQRQKLESRAVVLYLQVATGTGTWYLYIEVQFSSTGTCTCTCMPSTGT